MVWLEPVPSTRVEELRWTPDVDTARLRLDVRLTRGHARPLRLQVLTLHGEVLVDDVVAVRGDRVQRDLPLAQTDIALAAPTLLWSPETPDLIDAQVRVLDGDDVVDEVGSYAAMRGISTSEQRIMLNGRPYFLRLVLAQGYWPEPHLAAPGWPPRTGSPRSTLRSSAASHAGRPPSSRRTRSGRSSTATTPPSGTARRGRTPVRPCLTCEMRLVTFLQIPHFSFSI